MTQGCETRLDGETLIVRIPMRFQRRGGRKRIVAPDGSAIVPATKPQPAGTLVKALARTWRWQQMFDEGVYTSVTEISESDGIKVKLHQQDPAAGAAGARHCRGDRRGQTDQALVLEKLDRPLPACWAEQRARILDPKTSLPV